MTDTLQIDPADTSFQASTPEAEVLHVQLDGGFGRTRADQDNATWLVDASWIMNFYEYRYFMAFYRHSANSGATQVYINLTLDAPAAQAQLKLPYLCNFVPGSVKLSSKSGGSPAKIRSGVYIVQARLEVAPSADDPNGDAAVVAAYVGAGDVTKLAIRPTDEGYTVDPPQNEALSTKLDGPASLYRFERPGGVLMVNVSWILTEADFKYFMCFWRNKADRGATPVNMDLVVDGRTYNQHKVKFIPGSLVIQSKNSKLFVVASTVEVLPDLPDDATDVSVISTFSPSGGY